MEGLNRDLWDLGDLGDHAFAFSYQLKRDLIHLSAS